MMLSVVLLLLTLLFLFHVIMSCQDKDCKDSACNGKGLPASFVPAKYLEPQDSVATNKRSKFIRELGSLDVESKDNDGGKHRLWMGSKKSPNNAEKKLENNKKVQNNNKKKQNKRKRKNQNNNNTTDNSNKNTSYQHKHVFVPKSPATNRILNISDLEGLISENVVCKDCKSPVFVREEMYGIGSSLEIACTHPKYQASSKMMPEKVEADCAIPNAKIDRTERKSKAGRPSLIDFAINIFSILGTFFS